MLMIYCSIMTLEIKQQTSNNQQPPNEKLHSNVTLLDMPGRQNTEIYFMIKQPGGDRIKCKLSPENDTMCDFIDTQNRECYDKLVELR